MNKKNIIGFVLIIASIFIFTNMSNDISTYSNFSDAIKMDRKVKIVGQLVLSEPMLYNPEVSPNEFRFHLVDNDGVQKQVLLLKPKPTDFEKSDQIVLTGEMEEDIFVAEEILMKCPSKYKEEELYIKDKNI